MTVLIVSRTQMGSGRVCVGALDTAAWRNVRLLMETGANQPETAPYQIGQLWDMRYRTRPSCTVPHVEDVLVQDATQVGTEANIAGFIHASCPVVTGALSRTFDGRLQLQTGGAAYISRQGGLPSGSVCFWQTDSDLQRKDYYDKVKFFYSSGREHANIAYVGTAVAPAGLARGSLLRLSLARWWTPNDAAAGTEERCYLQLSGAYL